MKLGYTTSKDYLLHENGKGHPERPDRLRAIWKAIDDSGLDERLVSLDPMHAPVDAIAAVHDRDYIASIERACKKAPARLDADTGVTAASYDVARLASGAAIGAVDAVMNDTANRVLCAHRPPGHHAEKAKAMGFCLFNHVAVAAQHAAAEHGLKRVAIVDFDVHHGNGTQHSFEERADVLFVSIHQDPRTCYPGTGRADETGRGAGKGFTLNVPVMPGADDGDYERAFDRSIVPKLNEYEPALLLISAGFDAAREDPLAQVDLTTDAFAMMTRKLVGVANEHAAGRIVSVLEGGYDLGALGRGVVAHLEELGN